MLRGVRAALRLREGEASAVMVAYDLLELEAREGQDIRREPLQDRRKRLERLLRQPKGKAAQKIASALCSAKQSLERARRCSAKPAAWA
jgi:ATP-dependent DNA ligase